MKKVDNLKIMENLILQDFSEPDNLVLKIINRYDTIFWKCVNYVNMKLNNVIIMKGWQLTFIPDYS